MNYPTTAGMCYATIFGIDSHKRTTTICALDTGTGSVEKRTFPDNDYGKMAEFMKGFDTPAWGVYEAGCTGNACGREALL